MKRLILFFTNRFTRHYVYCKIRSFFISQQRWLTKAIPRTYCDKVELVPCVLFAILVDFVEKEKGLSQLDVDWTQDLADGHVSQAYIDATNARYGELRDAYNYIKTERDALQSAYDNSYPVLLPGVSDMFEDATVDATGNKSSQMKTCEELYGVSYTQAYAETNRLEALLEERDHVDMMTIVRHVKSIWK